MPNANLHCEKGVASGLDVQPESSPQLSEDEVKDIYRFVNKVADNVSEGKLTYKDNLIQVEIKQNNIILECIDKTKSCTGPKEVETVPGRLMCICPRLSPILEYAQQVLERKQPAPRNLADKKKVGKYLYKLQPNQAGHNYWYLQFTENGRSKQEYLGKQEPTFDPKKDIERARRRKARKKKIGEAVVVNN